MNKITTNPQPYIISLDLSQPFNKVDADISELKSELAQVKTDVALLKSDVAVLKSDMVELKKELNDVKLIQAEMWGQMVRRDTFEPWQAKIEQDIIDIKSALAELLFIVREMQEFLMPLSKRHSIQIDHINQKLGIDWVA